MKRYVKVEVFRSILEYLSFRVSLDTEEDSVESTVKDSGHVLQLQFYAILSPMPFLPFPLFSPPLSLYRCDLKFRSPARDAFSFRI